MRIRARAGHLVICAMTGGALSGHAAAGELLGQPADQQEAPGQPAVDPEQGEAPTPEQLRRERPIVYRIRATGELAMNSDLRDAPGDVTVSRVGAGVGVVIPVRQAAQIEFSIDYEFSHYAFSGATSFAAGFDSPWERMHREAVSVLFSQQETMDLSWSVGGIVGFAHEEGASISDSFTGAVLGGVRYRVAENVFIGGSAILVSTLEDGMMVIPAPAIDWRINERLRLSSGRRPGVTLDYLASDELTFSFGAGYEWREYRLRDDGPAPDGVARDRRVPIFAAVTYTPTPQLSIELSGGAFLLQRYRLLDNDGNRLADIDGKPVPFTGLQVSYRF